MTFSFLLSRFDVRHVAVVVDVPLWFTMRYSESGMSGGAWEITLSKRLVKKNSFDEWKGTKFSWVRRKCLMNIEVVFHQARDRFMSERFRCRQIQNEFQRRWCRTWGEEKMFRPSPCAIFHRLNAKTPLTSQAPVRECSPEERWKKGSQSSFKCEFN